MVLQQTPAILLLIIEITASIIAIILLQMIMAIHIFSYDWLKANYVAQWESSELFYLFFIYLFLFMFEPSHFIATANVFPR